MAPVCSKKAAERQKVRGGGRALVLEGSHQVPPRAARIVVKDCGGVLHAPQPRSSRD